MNKICSKCKVEKDVCFFGKDLQKKDGLHSSCRACKKQSDISYRGRNRSAILISKKAYKAKQKDKWNQYNKTYYQKNRDALCARVRLYAVQNPDKVSQNKRNYYLNNKDRFVLFKLQRRCNMLQATPNWIDTQKIKQIYLEASRLTNSTGVPHEVDHIIPIKGKQVCGLHVHNNLRIITRKENRSKSNSFLPDLVEQFYAELDVQQS